MEAARVHRFKRGSGLPIKAPVIDMIEIGAGGGSIAGIDEVGLLRVGPRSAGADPGPACYGRGGTEADRHRRQPACSASTIRRFFLGGRMTLDRKAADDGASASSATRSVCRPWRPPMASTRSSPKAWRRRRASIWSRRARTRARYAMVGFGGAGPAHAAGVARILGIREVIIPPASGAASCLGFLVAPLSFERVRSYPVRIAKGYDAVGDQRDSGRARDRRPRAARRGRHRGRAGHGRAQRRHAAGRADARDQRAAPAGTIGEASLDAIRTAFAERLYQALHVALRRSRHRGDQLPRARARPAPELR